MLNPKIMIAASLWILAAWTGPITPASCEPATVLGNIDGTFKVDHQGGAVYDIPIVLPPGTAGVAPKLTLTYNSHQGASFVGTGWALTGFPAVTRCSIRRLAPDGTLDTHPVAYGDSDRFCLDGALLVAVRGQYGAPGTIYHTESQSWKRIESLGACGSGPCEFKVTLKNGSHMRFGSTDDSRVEAVSADPQAPLPAGSVRTWAVSEIRDLNHNYVAYTYLEDDQSGEHLPHRVKYTGNRTPGAERAPLRVVELIFEDRAAFHNVVYQGGARMTQGGRRLARLESCLAATPIDGCSPGSGGPPTPGFQRVGTYLFDYEASPTTFRSRLKEITRLGAGHQEKLPPLRFSYQAPPENAFEDPEPWSEEFTWANGWSEQQCQQRRVTDINGDGRLDIIGFGALGTYFALSNVDGLKPTVAQDIYGCDDGYSQVELYPRHVGDFNGDGKVDILGMGQSALWVSTWQGRDFSAPTSWSVALTHSRGWNDEVTIRSVADINGDGRSDLIGFGETRVAYMVSEGDRFSEADGFYGHFTTVDGYRSVKDYPRVLADLNGDGRADIVGFRGREVQVGLSTGFGFEEPQTWSSAFYDEPCHDPSWVHGRNPRYVSDVNGDGLADLIGFSNCRVIVSFSTGRSFTAPRAWSSDFTYDRGWDDSRGTLRLLSDINGDGWADIVAFGHSAVRFGVSTGRAFETDFFAPLEDVFGEGSPRRNPRYPADLSGSGMPAIVGFGDTHLWVATASELKPDLLTTVENGIGGRISLSHGSISSSGAGDFYQPEAPGDGYPYREFNAALQVVTQQRNHDGRGNTYRYDYRYSGAQADALERGFLGFRSMTTIDRQMNPEAANPGLASVSRFHQRFPLRNLLERLEIKVLQDDRTLSVATNHYGSRETSPGVFDVFKSRESVAHYSLSSSGSYSTARLFTYDDFGNVVLKEDLGNEAVPDDDLTTCARYVNDPGSWRLGYPTETTSAASCTVEADGCRCEPALLRSRKTYSDDGRMRLIASGSWVDTSNSWLGEVFDYDTVGNVISQSDAYWLGDEEIRFNPRRVQFDDIFQTFPVKESNVYFSQELQYDPRFGTVVESRDANGVVMAQVLDGFGRPLQASGPDPDGSLVALKSFSYVLTADDRYTEIRDLVSWQGTTTWQRDHIDGLGRVVRHESQTDDACVLREDTVFLSMDQVEKASLPYFAALTGGSCPQQASPQWIHKTYDSAGRLKAWTQPDGVLTTLAYDIVALDGQMVDFKSQTRAAGTPDAMTSSSYLNALGSLVRKDFPSSSPNDLSTRAAVKPSRLDTSAKEPSTRLRYDRLQRVVRADSPGGIYSQFAYDSLGRTVSERSLSSGTDTFQYSLKGFLTQQQDALGQKVALTFDEIGRPVTETAITVDGNVSQTRFTFGHTSDPGQASSETPYGIGRLIRVEEPGKGLSHHYQYDPYGNRVGSRLEVDGHSYQLWMSYDPMARLILQTYPDGAQQRNRYDLTGHLQSVALCPDTEACEQGLFEDYVRYEAFTALGKPQILELRGGRAGYSRFVYDDVGRVLSMTSRSDDRPLIDKSFTWNPLSLVTRIDDHLDPESSRRFELNGAGYLTKAWIGDRELSYAYDPAGNLERKEDVDFEYQGMKPVRGFRDRRQVYSASYDAAGRMTRKQRVNPAGLTTDWTFELDAYGKLVEVKRREGLADDAAGSQTVGSYLYDYQGHLVRKEDARGLITYTISASYDVTVLPPDAPADPRLGTALVEPTVIDTKYVQGSGGVVASISNARSGLVSQIPNRLRHTVWLPAFWSFQGLRVRLRGLAVSLTASFGTVAARPATWVLIPALLLVAGLWIRRRQGLTQYARRRRFTRRATWCLLVCLLTSTVLPGRVLAELQPGANGRGIPVAGEILFFHHDLVQSTSVVTDENGTERTRVGYLPYGEIFEQESRGPDDFRAKFGGREWNLDLELYDFGSRYYDPFTGRFTQADSRRVGAEGGAAVAMNRFAYAANNPVSYVDPTGESALLAIAAAFSAAFVAMTSVATGGLASLLAPQALGGAFFGASSVNHNQFNPAKWEFDSWKTYAGAVIGIAIAEAGEAISFMAPELLPAGAGAAATFAAGMLGATGAGFVEGASYAFLGGADFAEAMTQGGIGAAVGFGATAAAAGAGRAVGRLRQAASRIAKAAGRLGRRSSQASSRAGRAIGCSSFEAGTVIATADGAEPIERIELGEHVWAYDESLDRTALYPVTGVIQRTSRDGVVLGVESDGPQEISTTAEHPFHVHGAGWVAAGNLSVGMKITRKNGGTAEITHLTRRNTPARVFNFEVGGAHTYFVAEGQLLVHNPGSGICSRVPSAPSSKALATSTPKPPAIRPFQPTSQLPKGSSFKGKIYRFQGMNDPIPTFKDRGFTKGSAHRFSGPGQEGLYVSTSRIGLLGEMRHAGFSVEQSMIYTQNIELSNLLDLTQPLTRKRLGITLEEITIKGSHTFTREIGQWADGPYNGILFPSSHFPDRSHIVMFRDTKIDGMW